MRGVIQVKRKVFSAHKKGQPKLAPCAVVERLFLLSAETSSRFPGLLSSIETYPTIPRQSNGRTTQDVGEEEEALGERINRARSSAQEGPGPPEDALDCTVSSSGRPPSHARGSDNFNLDQWPDTRTRTHVGKCGGLGHLTPRATIGHRPLTARQPFLIGR